MGLFDSFMPGESSGMPTGILGGWQGALEGNNPMLNIGLGILANNSGNYGSLGAALGKGAQQGIQNTQASRQAQQQAALYKLQMAKHQKEVLEAQQQAKFGEEFKTKHPDLAGYYDIDPKGAYKLANPQMNADGVDNVYLPTPNGILRANKKNSTDFGYLNIDGKPVMRSQDDPALRGAVKNAEAQAGANWNMYGGIDGVVTTEAQAAEMARGGNPAPFAPQQPQQPQARPQMPLPAGIPQNMQIPPQVQKRRDDVRMQILMAEQAQSGGAGANPELDQEIANMGRQSRTSGGIRVPTKLETKQGEANIDLRKDLATAEGKAGIELRTKPLITAADNTAKIQAESSANAKINLPKIESSAKITSGLVNELLNHKGFSSSVGATLLPYANRVDGTKESDFNSRLKQLDSKAFLDAFESLKGGGAITEIEGTKATQAISRMNTSTSEEEFKSAAKDFLSVVDSSLKSARKKAGQDEFTPAAAKNTAKPKAPMKGQVVNGYKFKGGNPADQNNWELK